MHNSIYDANLAILISKGMLCYMATVHAAAASRQTWMSLSLERNLGQLWDQNADSHGLLLLLSLRGCACMLLGPAYGSTFL
jgi:hypothetical protein